MGYSPYFCTICGDDGDNGWVDELGDFCSICNACRLVASKRFIDERFTGMFEFTDENVAKLHKNIV